MPRLDPEIVTHDSFIATIDPIRAEWNSRHADDVRGGKHSRSHWGGGSGDSPFDMMLAELTGRSPRRIRGYLAGTDTVSLQVADEILAALDRPDLFHFLDIRRREAT